MDEVDVLVALAKEPELERPLEVLVDGGGEAVDLLVVELGRERERRQARTPEDLVRVCAPDARERALVAQQRVQAAVVGVQDLAQPGRVHVERVGAEVRQLGLGRRRASRATPLRASSAPTP